MENLQFAVLGPLAIRQGRRPVPVRGWREHVVLAMLLLADGGVVTVDRLVDAVWDDAPPARAVKAVRNSISALRRRLAHADGPAVPIETMTAGYRLRVEDCRVDAHEFRQQADAARRLAAAGHTASAAAGLRSALGMWRGPALAGIRGRIVQASSAQLDEQRMAALEECLDLELALGRHRQAVSELQALVRECPLQERTVAQLMLALYRSGRQGEALGAYRQLADRLADELGIHPAGETTRLRQAILRQDPSLDRAYLNPRTIPTSSWPASITSQASQIGGIRCQRRSRRR